MRSLNRTKRLIDDFLPDSGQILSLEDARKLIQLHEKKRSETKGTQPKNDPRIVR